MGNRSRRETEVGRIVRISRLEEYVDRSIS